MQRKTYKYRIYPTKSQIGQLENTFSMCRHLYNWSLEERIKAYEKKKVSIGYYEQQNTLPKLKKERPWFKSVYSQVLQDVLKRLDKAYQRFFKEKGGFPNYKKRGQWVSITYPQFSQLPDGNRLFVPKLGVFEIVYHRPIDAKAHIKTLTICKEGGKWFVCFSVEISSPEPKRASRSAIGIDLGVIDFIYASDGTHIAAPRFFRQKEKALAKLHRKLSRTPKRTKQYYRALKALKKAYYRLRCLRLDFLHKEANRLLQKADCVIHEDLNIKGMMQGFRGLNKSIADVGWGLFLNILRYKAEEAGKQLIGVNARWTSQMCSQCGTLVTKSLSTRTHVCFGCGYQANRDLNAANNILRLGLQSAGIQTQEAPTIAQA